MKKIANYILLITSVTITFLLVEIGFRFAAYLNDLNTLEQIYNNRLKAPNRKGYNIFYNRFLIYTFGMAPAITGA